MESYALDVTLGNMISHPHTGERIKLFFRGDCNTDHVIYTIKCPCGLLYVGKTERKLKTCITEHKSRIRNNITSSSLAKHWNAHSHRIAQLKFQIVEVVKVTPGVDTNKRLLQREAFWMKRLGTLHPQGLNDRFEMSCFL